MSSMHSSPFSRRHLFRAASSRRSTPSPQKDSSALRSASSGMSRRSAKRGASTMAASPGACQRCSKYALLSLKPSIRPSAITFFPEQQLKNLE